MRTTRSSYEHARVIKNSQVGQINKGANNETEAQRFPPEELTPHHAPTLFFGPVVGHRLDPWMPSVTAKLKAHAATMKKYPPKQIGL